MISELFFCLREWPFASNGWRALAEQAAIRQRHARHAPLWGTHLAVCRDIVRDAALAAKEKRLAVVLGSGLLLDVPVDELCAAFDRVILVDLHHPSPARRAKRRHANLELMSADVTSDGFWESLPSRADFLVSLNLAAQLALKPGGEAASARHIQALKEAEGTRLLISEFMRVELDGEGRQIASEPALQLDGSFDLPEKSWRWYLAPMGELAPYRGLALDVGAWMWRE
jgi:hypothetical protein